MADIFLSYKKEDRTRIDGLAAALTAEGFSVWFDYQIETGGDWFEQILVEVRAAPCVIGCWTNNCVQADGLFARSTNSNLSYVLQEHREAGAKLLPTLLDRDVIPAEFGQLQAEDLIGWTEDRSDPRWRKLIARVETLVAPTAPPWIRRRIAAHDAVLQAERARREQAEDRAAALSQQLTEEAQKGAGDSRELRGARARVEELLRAVGDANDRVKTLDQDLVLKSQEVTALKALHASDQNRIRELESAQAVNTKTVEALPSWSSDDSEWFSDDRLRQRSLSDIWDFVWDYCWPLAKYIMIGAVILALVWLLLVYLPQLDQILYGPAEA